MTKKLLLLLTMIFTSFQVSALSHEEWEKCYSKKVRKQEHLEGNLHRFINTYSFDVMFSEMTEKVKEAQNCRELEAKMKPIYEDVKKLIAIDMKYKMKHKSEEMTKAVDELKKANEIVKNEEAADFIDFMTVIIEAAKHNEASAGCLYDKKVSIQCPEGFYKYSK